MPVKVNTCTERVEYNRYRVAFTRGPLVYCGEGIDNGGAVQRFFVNPRHVVRKAKITTNDDPVLKGQPLLAIPAKERTKNRTNDGQLKLIPYFAWANRDRSSMLIWYGTKEEIAKLDMRDPENTKFASVRASSSTEVTIY